MCLAFPGRIKGFNGKKAAAAGKFSSGFSQKAVVDYGSEEREAVVAGIEVRKGDWVLVQQGFVVEKLTEKEAEESLKAFKEQAKK